ncbi:zf-TFIIB domain-containing protein [bacterium]|nr:zf-TFIIB domain-containing protein [bacterium]
MWNGVARGRGKRRPRGPLRQLLGRLAGRRRTHQADRGAQPRLSPRRGPAVEREAGGGPAGYQHGPRDAGPQCPRCDALLRSYNYAYSTGVIVDRCPACKGIWTDYSEIEQIEILMSQAPSGSNWSTTRWTTARLRPFPLDNQSPLAGGLGRRYGGLFWFLRLFS